MKHLALAVAALSLCSTAALAGEAPAAMAPAANAPAANAPAANAPAAKAPAAKAPAAVAAPAPMDMSKMGPASRKSKNEKAVKKEILAFFKAEDDLAKKQDMEGMLARIDFPVFMATDDQKGVPEAGTYTREQYVAMMKPFMDNMPKDSSTRHKPSITVLSDSLLVVADDFVMTAGKMKMAGRNASLLVKRDGKWMWKVMAEAGWGGMDAPAAKPELKGEMMHDTKDLKKDPGTKAAAAPKAPMKK